MAIKEKIIRIISLTSIFTGILVIIGWWFDISLFKSVILGLPDMRFSTALCFIFSGASLFTCSIYISKKSEIPTIIIPFLSLSIFLIMFSFLIMNFIGVESTLEFLFIPEIDIANGIKSRPSIGTIFSFITIAVTSFAVLFIKDARKNITMAGGIIVMFLGAVAVIGHIFKFPLLYWDFNNISNAMAVHTATLFVLLGIGFLILNTVPETVTSSPPINLKSKFFVVTVGCITLPVFFVILLAISNIRQQVSVQSIHHLESIAKLEELRINDTLYKYRLIAQGIMSRTLLRSGLESYSNSQNEETRLQIYNVLKYAVEPFDEIKEVALFNTNGTIVAIVPQSEKFEEYNNIFSKKENPSSFKIYKENNKNQIILTQQLLTEKNEVIGTLILNFGSHLFDMVTSSYAGLGKSGEMILGFQNEDGNAEFLTTPRFMTTSNIVHKDYSNLPINQAILGYEKTFEAAKDYRGISVLAVTRHIDETGWGFVVKMDKEEIFSSTKKITNSLSLIGIFVVVFSLFISFFVPKIVAENNPKIQSDKN